MDHKINISDCDCNEVISFHHFMALRMSSGFDALMKVLNILNECAQREMHSYMKYTLNYNGAHSFDKVQNDFKHVMYELFS